VRKVGYVDVPMKSEIAGYGSKGFELRLKAMPYVMDMDMQITDLASGNVFTLPIEPMQ
jgi:hypothetical protein